VNTLNYLLPVAIAGLGIFGLVKDWDAHRHLFRRLAVFTLLLVVAIGSIVNTYASNKRATEREEANQKQMTI
jgi:hypothetical protein